MVLFTYVHWTHEPAYTCHCVWVTEILYVWMCVSMCSVFLLSSYVSCFCNTLLGSVHIRVQRKLVVVVSSASFLHRLCYCLAGVQSINTWKRLSQKYIGGLMQIFWPNFFATSSLRCRHPTFTATFCVHFCNLARISTLLPSNEPHFLLSCALVSKKMQLPAI